MAALEFDVIGVPAPQGSMRAFVVKGRPILTSSNKSLASWRQLVSLRLQDLHLGAPLQGPLKVDLRFFLPRPKSIPKKEEWPIKRKNDIDKLVRGVLDSMSGIVFGDDGQVVYLMATKEWALDRPPGVYVIVGAVE